MILVGAVAACSGADENGAEVSTTVSAVTGGNDACADHRALLRAALVGPRSEVGAEDSAVHHGRKAFDDRELEGLGGNGRACADCHNASDHFQLSPATVKARLAALEKCRTEDPTADDPLFRPVDADDFRVNGSAAHSFKNLQFGLVRVTLPLPPNLKLVVNGQVSNQPFIDVWRAVPSVFNVATTGPDGQQPIWPPPIVPEQLQRAADGSQNGPGLSGGYQVDARFETLQAQAEGALLAHAEIQNAPPVSFLDNLAAFQKTLVTPGEPPLTPLEEQGKAVFNRSCAQCHGGQGTTTPIHQIPDIPRFQNILSTCPRPLDSPTWCVASGGQAPCPPRFVFKQCPSVSEVPGLAQQTVEITLPTGTKFRRSFSDAGRFLLTGFTGAGVGFPLNERVLLGAKQDLGVFDNMPLKGIRHTAPYFHNNTAKDLDEVIDHYEALFTFFQFFVVEANVLRSSPTSGFDRLFTAEEKPALKAYLLTL